MQRAMVFNWSFADFFMKFSNWIKIASGRRGVQLDIP